MWLSFLCEHALLNLRPDLGRLRLTHGDLVAWNLPAQLQTFVSHECTLSLPTPIVLIFTK